MKSTCARAQPHWTSVAISGDGTKCIVLAVGGREKSFLLINCITLAASFPHNRHIRLCSDEVAIIWSLKVKRLWDFKGYGCSCTPRQNWHTIIGIWLSPWKLCGHISFLLFEECPRMSSSLLLWHLLVRVKWNLKMKHWDTGTVEMVIKWPDWLKPPPFTATEQPGNCPRWPTAVINTNGRVVGKASVSHYSDLALTPGLV